MVVPPCTPCTSAFAMCFYLVPAHLFILLQCQLCCEELIATDMISVTLNIIITSISKFLLINFPAKPGMGNIWVTLANQTYPQLTRPMIAYTASCQCHA